jgi:hypothetical protein
MDGSVTRSNKGKQGGLTFKNEGTKRTLRMIGIALLVVGGLMTLIGGLIFFMTMTSIFSSDMSSGFGNSIGIYFLSFIIMGFGPMLMIVGGSLLYISFIGKVAQYYATETKGAFTTVGEGVGEGISRGWQKGKGRRRSRDDSDDDRPRKEIRVKCRKCGYLDTEDATYCSKCGGAL